MQSTVFTFFFLVLFSCQAAAQGGLSLTVIDAETHLIEGAAVHVDGVLLQPLGQGSYFLPGDHGSTNVVLVEAEKEGYLPFSRKMTINDITRGVNIYLVKEGEPVYYLDGIAIPYRSDETSLLVGLQSDQLPPPGQILEQLQPTLDKFSLTARFYTDILRESGVTRDSGNVAHQYVCIIRKKDGSAFPAEDCYELEALRQRPEVAFAGPVMNDNWETFHVRTFDCAMLVHTRASLTEDQLRLILAPVDLEKSKIEYIRQNIWYVSGILSDNRGVVRRIEYLMKQPEVSHVDSNVLMLPFLD